MVSYINIAGVTEYLNCLIKLTMTGQGAQQGVKEGKSGRMKTRDCRELWLDRIFANNITDGFVCISTELKISLWQDQFRCFSPSRQLQVGDLLKLGTLLLLPVDPGGGWWG